MPSSGNVRSYAILLRCLQLLLGAFLLGNLEKLDKTIYFLPNGACLGVGEDGNRTFNPRLRG